MHVWPVRIPPMSLMSGFSGVFIFFPQLACKMDTGHVAHIGSRCHRHVAMSPACCSCNATGRATYASRPPRRKLKQQASAQPCMAWCTPTNLPHASPPAPSRSSALGLGFAFWPGTQLGFCCAKGRCQVAKWLSHAVFAAIACPVSYARFTFLHQWPQAKWTLQATFSHVRQQVQCTGRGCASKCACSSESEALHK